MFIVAGDPGRRHGVGAGGDVLRSRGVATFLGEAPESGTTLNV
jgi:hypothetical protein